MDISNWIDELLLRYSILGFEGWRRADDDLIERANLILQGQIVERDRDVRQIIGDIYGRRRSDVPLMIPTPKPHRHIEQAFFLPLFQTWNGQASMLSFDLLLIVNDRNCLAYRWEPAEMPDDDETTTHEYGHVQLCKRLANR